MIEIRKFFLIVEETHAEQGKTLDKPLKKVASGVVIKNPFNGIYVEDLEELMDFGAKMGEKLATKAMEALNDNAESYGKAAVVGEGGELEHAAALLHPKLGKPFRNAIGGGKSIIPSVKKIGKMGDSLDIPLHFKDAAFVRTHFDGMTVSVSDAPKTDEILLVIAVTNGGRPHPRVGGLTKEEAKCEDGLR
jgi:hypothetical protein